MIAQGLTMVGGNDDQSVVRQAALFQFTHELPDIIVGIIHSRVVLINAASRVPCGFRRGCGRAVWVMHVDVVEESEERSLTIAITINPSQSFFVHRRRPLANAARAYVTSPSFGVPVEDGGESQAAQSTPH